MFRIWLFDDLNMAKKSLIRTEGKYHKNASVCRLNLWRDARGGRSL